MPAPTLTPLERAAVIAEALIAEHHPHLRDAGVIYLSTDAKPGRGCKFYGVAKILSPLERHLAGDTHEIALVIPELSWDALSGTQRAACVDHLLSHLGVEDPEDGGEPRFVLRDHDVAEFIGVLERHGTWQPALRRMDETVRQLALPSDSSPRVDRHAEMVDRILDGVTRLNAGDRDGVPPDAAAAFDRLTTMGATVTVGGARE